MLAAPMMCHTHLQNMNTRKKYNRDFTCPIPRATRWRQSNSDASLEGELGHYSEHLLFSQELLEKAGLDEASECQFNFIEGTFTDLHSMLVCVQ